MRWFRRRGSFTLIELVVIISVIAVLAAISFPAAGAVLDRVHRAKAAGNLRTIALAYAQFINDFGRAITFTDVKNISGNNSCDVNSLAAVLSKFGYIGDVSVWAWDFDPLVKKFIRESNLWPTEIHNNSTGKVAVNFRGKAAGGNFPASVTCAVIQCPNFDYKLLSRGKFPVAYSRGLQPNGYWKKWQTDDNLGVFQDKGGFIAYLDGSVEWCENVVNKFTDYHNNTRTSKICKSLPNNHLSMGVADYLDSNFLNWVGYNACD